LIATLQMLTHLGNFPARLAEDGHAVYEYTPCPPVGYPELDAELWCHRYYLRNLCDTERFPDWPIVDHVPFLQVGQGARFDCCRVRSMVKACTLSAGSG
jgi:hypothetical protein